MPWTKLEPAQAQTMCITIIMVKRKIVSDNDNNRILSSSQDGTKKQLNISLWRGLYKTAG